MDTIKSQIESCMNFGELYTLSDQFAAIGLAVCECNSRRVVLCRVKDGCPMREELSKDFIFIGSTNHEREVIPDSLRACVIEFVEKNASKEKLSEKNPPKWNGIYTLYASPIAVANDDVVSTMQDMCLENAVYTTEGSLLDAIAEWLGKDNAQL